MLEHAISKNKILIAKMTHWWTNLSHSNIQKKKDASAVANPDQRKLKTDQEYALIRLIKQRQSSDLSEQTLSSDHRVPSISNQKQYICKTKQISGLRFMS